MKKAIFLFAVLFSSLLLGASSAPESDPEANSKSSETIVYLDDHTFYTVPPENFDPLTASDEELKMYGIPERPNDEEGLAFWESLYSNKPTFIAPVIEEVTDWHSSRLQLPSTLSDKEVADKAILNSSSLNWSGVIRNSTSYGANGVITIPTVYADSSHRPANCAGWVGIGGTSSSSALAQLGFDGVVSSSGAVSYNLWYETIGTNVSDAPIYITNISVSSGDNLFISVWLDYSAATGVNIVYYFFNQTQNIYSNVTVNVTSYSNITSSAEWIMERPMINNNFANLAKPTTSSSNIMCFSSCNYRSSQNAYSWVGMSGGTVYDMKNSQNVMLAQGSGFSSYAMNITWKNYK